MKRIIILSAIIALFLPACEVLEVDPYHSMPADQAITDAAGVTRGILGCYDAMQGVGHYGRNYIVVGDLAADILTWTGTTAGYNQINNNSILADNVIVEGIWASIYNGLNRINNVIAQIPAVEGMTTQQKDRALAELYFLRALHHYDLVRLFGDVPLRTEPVFADEEMLNVPRQPVADVMASVNADLDFAISHLQQNITRGRASRPAAQALKARVSLHQFFMDGQTAHLNNARNHATAVINHPGLQLETNYAALFSGESNRESVFEIEFNEQDRNRFAEYFFHTSLSGRYEFAPTQAFINSFSPDDIRRDVIIAMAAGNPYANKYIDIVAGADNAYVFRLAEMYLIRAEAETLLQGDGAGIRSDIDAIRVRAGLSPTTISDNNYQAFRLEIESQRMKEFAFEGHRWFDLVRTNRAQAVLENVNTVEQTLFPIPLTEILANDNPGMVQNPGY
jgi:starch-binding outer membrane protein, SusD/RagB family